MPQAAAGPLDGRASLLEDSEQARQLRSFDAYAVVANGDAHLIAQDRSPDFDLTTRRGVLRGID